MKSIWDNIKLAFGRKPQGDILLPEVPSGVEIIVRPPQKPKRIVVRKKKSDVNNT
jgi:hypothetical protein